MKVDADNMENGKSLSKTAVSDIEKKLLERIKGSEVSLRIMHVCGTHERTIAKYGLRSVLPQYIEVISGPGCPVCVTPERDIDIAIALAKSGATVVTFGGYDASTWLFRQPPERKV